MNRTSPPMGLVNITDSENGRNENEAQRKLMNIIKAIVANVLGKPKAAF